MILPPQPPSPPKVLLEDSQKDKKKNKQSMLDDLGIDKEYFAHMALVNGPNWEADELDLLESLYNGDEIEDAQEEALVDKFFSPEGVKVTPAPKQQSSREYALDDMSSIAMGTDVPFNTPSSYAPTPALLIPSSDINLDEWLSKK